MITLKMSTGKTRRINRAPNKEYVMEGFLEPGLVSYEAEGDGISRLDKEAIDKMLASFVGCPLVIEHTDEPKEAVLNGKTNEAGRPLKVGEVTKAWWNAETGKYDCSFTTEDEEALKKINEEGWSGSCAYNVREPLGEGGELHAMRYDNTILDGEFEHLALVPNPRYEDCTIRMNGKSAKIKENAIDEKAMFDKERAEHPSFTDEQINQIVEDHMKTKENDSFNTRDFLVKELDPGRSYSEQEIKAILTRGLSSRRDPNSVFQDIVSAGYLTKTTSGLRLQQSKQNTVTLKNAEKKDRPISVVKKGDGYTFVGPVLEDMMDGASPKKFESYSGAVHFAKERGYTLMNEKKIILKSK